MNDITELRKALKLKDSDPMHGDSLLLHAAQRIRELEAALNWYGEQARLARLIHSEGDAGRHALAADGGKKAKQLLEPPR